MAYCSSCGAQTDGSFCGTCGAQIGGAAQGAVPAAQSAQAAPIVAGKKKTSPIVWIVGGMVALFVLMGIFVLGAGFFVANKVKNAGFDSSLMEKNPALAAAKLAVSLNPELEIVNMDENKGVLTVREKKTGKTITMNADDIKNGKLTFSDESGEKMTFGGDSGAQLPAWVPAYPGAKAEAGVMSASGKDGEGGMAHFKTKDPAAKVLSFYQDALKGAGYKITASMAGDGGESSGGLLTAEDAANKRTIAVTVGSGDEGTDVGINYGSKK